MAPRAVELSSCGEIAGDARKQYLRLRVAETHVEFDHARTVLAPHQSAVENADVRLVFGDQSGEHGGENSLAHSIEEIVRKVRRRRIGAHPTGVGAGVAIAGALVVARRTERDDGATVAQRKDANLAAFETLFEQHVGAAAGYAVVSVPVRQHRLRRRDAGRHDDALSGG